MALHNQISVIQKLIEAKPTNRHDNITSLYNAAQNGHLLAVILLIERKADINFISNSAAAAAATANKSKLDNHSDSKISNDDKNFIRNPKHSTVSSLTCGRALWIYRDSQNIT